MRWRVAVLGAVMVLSVGSLQAAFAQMKSPPGGTTPGGAIFDGLNRSSTRPVPQTPPPAVRQPDMQWVPDRFVQVPGTDGQILVPGHWERRLSDSEVFTPPLTGRSPQGDTTIHFPAGSRPPVHEREYP
ncbi:MAG: hypothetical protein ACRELZ_23960 [Candidatus Rokuibacteriota bacterium]